MLPILFRIPLPWGGHLPVHGYGVMIVIGFLLAALVASREARRRGMPDFIYDMGLVMLLSGLLGGRLFYYLENYEEKYAHESLLEFFKIWKGGLVFYGGAIAGFIGGWIYCWKKRLPVGACLDISAIGVPIGMAFGRLGCFLNGCCYGELCDPGYPLGVVFPVSPEDSPSAAAQRSLGLLEGRTEALPVHPVQLYQAAHDFLLFGLVFWYLRRSDAPTGGGIPLLFALYGVGRFCIEGLRGDNLPTFTGWTISQNFSILLTLVFGATFLLLVVRSRRRLAAGSRA